MTWDGRVGEQSLIICLGVFIILMGNCAALEG